MARTLGTSCNDGDANTIDDQWTASCQCVGTAVTFDCEAWPTDRRCLARPATTQFEHGQRPVGRELQLRGQLVDCQRYSGFRLPGTACNDGDANTGNDTWDANCNCVGQLIDCEGIPVALLSPERPATTVMRTSTTSGR